MPTKDVWPCAHKAAVGCPQRCTGSVSSELWLWAHKEMWLCLHKGEVTLCFLVAGQCATQGITVRIALVAVE